MRLTFFILFSCISAFAALSQNKLELDGQASLFGNYSPDSEMEVFTGVRYIPELNYHIGLESARAIDFLGAVNIYGNSAFHPFDDSQADGEIKPYRIWARYTSSQLELRLGLQKIDFGTATILRPLQWFNQIDPRDPLSLTNGVYGLLGRYYFLNNANIWLWALYGNEETRGFDAVKTNEKLPEFGGRVQYPVPNGEIAMAYHYRTADSRGLTGINSHKKIPENRFGLDGKWDIGIGLWFEASYIHKSKNIGSLTNQSLFNLGADYTFGIGSGLNVVAEHLIMAYDENVMEFGTSNNITAANISYPLNLFDNLSSVLYYSWDTDDFLFFINYEHQFKKLIGYVMAYYNPETQQAFQQNELVNTFTGPGIRLMLVYNH
ncbi:MAG TPA: hypothetical protein VK982_14805 [Bacteroidales bacterium]|nr:hypothetical protein [Bacteroidales bacterium]